MSTEPNELSERIAREIIEEVVPIAVLRRGQIAAIIAKHLPQPALGIIAGAKQNTAQINGEVLVEFTRAVAETCKWNKWKLIPADEVKWDVECNPEGFWKQLPSNAQYCMFCGKVISHE